MDAVRDWPVCLSVHPHGSICPSVQCWAGVPLQSAILDIEVDLLHLTGPTELAVLGYGKPVSFGKMYDFAYRPADSDFLEVHTI
ncbi:hypothetical protein O3P69_015293 [Scylla paramamosain]|uniref:Uncharacterized protein n=1 Tax=Scylla paramamosain TaxID=85552 RepID=A0AAW0T651_SCYPA